MLEAVRCDLFPTADMIRSVSRDLGMVPGRTEQEIQLKEEEEEKEEEKEEGEVQETTDVSPSLSARERRSVPLDMHNTEFMECRQRIKHTLDYVKVCQVYSIPCVLFSVL